ncbi:hypothetical protein BN1200_530079 [Klebsiella variicola]|nr:hypothetical protein BN1200_530079 [Klebsiella variicola]
MSFALQMTKAYVYVMLNDESIFYDIFIKD